MSVHLSTGLGGVSVVVVEILRRSLLALGGILGGELLVKEICRDIMYIYKFHVCCLNHVTIPLSISVVASLDLPIWPFISWG